MILVTEKITKDKVQEMKRDCFDYSQAQNDAMLRERYIFMMRNEPGFVCVEGNTNGFFVVGREASLNQAMYHLKSC